VKKERKIREWTKTVLVFSVRERKDLQPNSVGSTHTERWNGGGQARRSYA